MKKKALRKDFRREIIKSRQRFLSIFLISALGVSFFAGLRSCKGDMLLSADSFYDATNMMDLRIVSTMGLEEADIAAVQAARGVKAAEGVKTKDVVMKLPGKKLVLKLYSLTEKVNTYRIEEGRLPQNNTECAADTLFLEQSGYRIGDRIRIDAADELQETELLITGAVSTGHYMSSSRGSGTVGNGKISSFLVLYPENIKSEYYTEMAVTFDGADQWNTYEEEYDAFIEQQINALEPVAEQREQLRLEAVQQDIKLELDEAFSEVQKQEAEWQQAEKEIADGLEQIKAGYTELEKAKEELAAVKEEAPETFTEYEEKIAAAKLLVEQAYEELTVQEAPVIAAREEYNGYVERLSAISQGPKDIERILALKGIYEEDILAAEAEIAEVRECIKAQETEIAAQEAELERQKQEWNDTLASSEEELTATEQDLKDKETQLRTAETDYQASYEETEQKIADAYAGIEEKRSEAANLAAPEWYMLNRNTIEAYVSFELDAERMDAIGEVFPFIFFLIAALVSLTTMTRMVDEERTQIGTLKALGYSQGAIAGKYMKYALYATLSGSVLGFLLGSKIFPYIVITTYKLVYSNLPEVIMPVNWKYSLLATALAVLCTTLSALAACIHELREQPAALMRPAAPKPGKRLLLERAGFLWKRLSFTRKASLRNMFRYKKRFFMTVTGIGCCMGLLLVGFGIKDSISVMSKIQYEELWLQDATVGLAAEETAEAKEQWLQGLQDIEEIQTAVLLKESFMDFVSGQTVKNAGLLVMPQTADFETFYVFRDRESGECCQIFEEGMILTEKLARLLQVKAGDTVILKPEETKECPVKVIAVAENYISHYGFMTAACYEQVFGEKPEYNECLLKLNMTGMAAEETLAEQLLAQTEFVTSVSMVSALQKSIDDMLNSLNVITYVLIVCAGLLAFIVLYNLSNINITERKRELATLKVLGFFDGEVSAYVYRENVLLTFLGMLVGVLIGRVLHTFIMQTVEVDMVMFGRIIEPVSYCYSALLTLVFSIVIGMFMHFKLKKIDMIESLKSME